MAIQVSAPPAESSIAPARLVGVENAVSGTCGQVVIEMDDDDPVARGPLPLVIQRYPKRK